MASEGRMQVGLFIRKSNSAGQVVLEFNKSMGYQFTVTGTYGNKPGDVIVPQSGVSITLSGISVPGRAWVHNRGPYDVELGMKESTGGLYLPLLEFPVGEPYPIVLSRRLFDEYGPGTGSGSGVSVNVLWARAINGGPSILEFLGFER